MVGDGLNLAQGLTLARVATRNILGFPSPLVVESSWRRVLKQAFPDLIVGRLLRGSQGERALYAFFEVSLPTGVREVFLKYRPPFNFTERHQKRFLNEIFYLRYLAPQIGVLHPRLLGFQVDSASLKAHLLTEGLRGTCEAWQDLSEAEQLRQFPRVIEQIGSFHAQWAVHPHRKRHASFPWSFPKTLEQVNQRLSQERHVSKLSGPVIALFRYLQDPSHLEALYRRLEHITLCHGDLHFGQLMFSKQSSDIFLLDYEHSAVAPMGFDLAHFLGLRLSLFERRQMETELLELYRKSLWENGWPISTQDILSEYQVGLVHNFVVLWSRYQREPRKLFRQLLERVAVAILDHSVVPLSAVSA